MKHLFGDFIYNPKKYTIDEITRKSRYEYVSIKIEKIFEDNMIFNDGDIWVRKDISHFIRENNIELLCYKFVAIKPDVLALRFYGNKLTLTEI